jgi:hypothetical protein
MSCGFNLQEIADGRRLAGAIRPVREDVIAMPFDLDPETDGLDGARLTDHLDERRKLSRIREIKTSGIAAMTEFGRGQGHGHRILLNMR